MISLFKYIFNKLFYNNIKSNHDNDNNKLDINIENLLDQIKEIRQNNIDTEELTFNVTHNEQGCFYKSGIISLVNNYYVLVENKYICETKDIIPIDLKEGDKVYYIAYKVSKNEELKIHKIIDKINISWDTDNQTECYKKDQISKNKIKENLNLNVPSSDLVLNKRQLNERVILGKVNKRKGRNIFLEDNICINLNNVHSTFIPMIGDWIQLECIVEVNEDVSNFKGEILEIKSLLPLRHLRQLGKVTEYNNILKFGIIENTIMFTKDVCTSGYIPCVGDKVVVQSIESDQGIQQQWRALTVVPFNV
jgi:hypothetical protein